MSLLHPTLGEMFDRVVALTVKVGVCEDEGKDASRFREEIHEICSGISQDKKDLCAKFKKELIDIHVEMFDMIACAEKGTEVSSVHLQKLNRRRVAIREEINKESGEYKGPERI